VNDWYRVMADAEYRRDRYLQEAERDRRLGGQLLAGSDGVPVEGGRGSLLGVLALALLSIVATGAIAPR